MKLQINQEKFYLKYAFFYTFIISVILLFPFAVYINYSIKIQEAKTQALMKDMAVEIITTMEDYDFESKEDFGEEEKPFIFPRFKQHQAGLYDENYNAIFTLIDTEVLNLNEGYHKLNKKRLYVLKFDTPRYFEAKFLIIQTDFDFYEIVVNMIIIFASIIVVTFFLSQIILRSFARPFNQINEGLDGFIKDSMHEINTPLAIININIDMFVEKFGKDKYLARIKSASKILSNIYNDMNYLIKEQTINAAPKENIDFTRFVKKSVDYFSEIAYLKGVEINSEIQEGLEIEFVPTKLQKIIDNNLSNAIKYSNEESEIFVTLKKRGDEIILGFRDFGIGIEEPEKVFSRYYREDQTKGGFGIGLNLVNKIINDENIKVNVESKLSEGSYFEYRFPMAQIS